MKVRVSAISFLLLSCNYCLCIDLFTSLDYETHPESATFGVSSRDDEFPFMAALGWKNRMSNEIEFICGGMLITPNFVLTAAHCLFVQRSLPNVIKIGGNVLNSTYNEDHIVSNYFVHPLYDNRQVYDDVALLQLAFISKKEPVCLWSRPTLQTSRVTAIGYGATGFAGSTTSILQKVKLIAVSERVCRAYHERERKFRFGVPDELLCAGDPAGRQDTCHGDSGGPLIVNTDDQQYAVGIISSGQACSGFPPAIYTRVSSYLGWIRSILQQYSYWEPKLCN